MEARNLSHQQPTRLRNNQCAYCGAKFSEPGKAEKEHVIGKNFVPKGTHNQQWNLHLNSCHDCNQRKSKSEDDLSAITLHPDMAQRERDALVLREAKRKSKAFSQRTGKPVMQSTEQFKVSGKVGQAEIEFSLISKPQFDRSRAFELASFQLRGFFFFLTYNADLDTGYHWPGCYMPIDSLPRSDWGNPRVLSFAHAVKDWDMRFTAVMLAQGFFGAIIKKHPTETLWSWALEWNKNIRLFGFLGDEVKARELLDALEVPQISPWVNQPTGNMFRYRAEVPMPNDTDDLFFFST